METAGLPRRLLRLLPRLKASFASRECYGPGANPAARCAVRCCLARRFSFDNRAGVRCCRISGAVSLPRVCDFPRRRSARILARLGARGKRLSLSSSFLTRGGSRVGAVNPAHPIRWPRNDRSRTRSHTPALDDGAPSDRSVAALSVCPKRAPEVFSEYAPAMEMRRRPGHPVLQFDCAFSQRHGLISIGPSCLHSSLSGR